MVKFSSQIILDHYVVYAWSCVLTQPGQRLHHGRLVVPDGLHRGEVVVEEVDAVSLEHAVGARRLPPRDLDRRVRHAQQAHVARRARSWKYTHI